MRLALTAAGTATAVEEAYRARQGRRRSVPKSGFDVTASTFFHAMPARYDAKAGVSAQMDRHRVECGARGCRTSMR